MPVIPSDPHRSLRSMRRGMVWFALGAGLIIAIHWFRTPAREPLWNYAPFVPMVAGAYGVVVGLEKMIAGFRLGRRQAEAASRRLVSRSVSACLALVSLAAGAGTAVYVHRAPYWKAVSRLAEGDGATVRLKAIVERHAALMRSGAVDDEALRSWGRSAEQALELRPAFAASLQAARYLAREASGALRRRARVDIEFYTLCLEWMDLYARVQRAFAEASMARPPEEWEVTQDDIILRIQALPKAQEEGA